MADNSPNPSTSNVDDTDLPDATPGPKMPGMKDDRDFWDKMIDGASNMALNVIASSERLTQAAQMGNCLFKAINNPSMFLNSLSMLGNMMGTAILQMVNRIMDVAWNQIASALGQVTSAVKNILGAAGSFLQAIADLLDSIIDLLDTIDNLSFNQEFNWLSEEECEYMFAAMAACMLNKLFGSKLKKLEEKITDKIVDTGEKLNSAVSDSLSGVNSMSDHINRQTQKANKMTKQIRGIDAAISSY